MNIATALQEELDSFAQLWIAERSLLLSSSMNKTTLEALQAELAAGLTAGESVEQLTKRIEIYFDGNAVKRAKQIARTEVIGASNEGALHRFELEGVQKSEFFPAADACPDCAALIGEYPTKESHGIIPVHPNCRCVWLPVIE